MGDRRQVDDAAARGSGAGNPRRLGDFLLVREIGRGGMGVVYEAQQTSLHRRVALKVLPPGLGLTPQGVQRFHREAEAAARLHHTHIVPVYAVGEEEGCHYYAMELIEGQPLTEVLRDLRGGGSSPLLQATVTRIANEAARALRSPSPAGAGPGGAAPGGAAPENPTITAPAVAPTPAAHPHPDPSATTSHGPGSLSDTASGSRHWFDTVARLVADVADALHSAHGRGVVHRDVKPANLLLSDDGRLCVTDFGLAQVAQEPGMTVSGSFLGTPAYMSPEQIAAGRVRVDHRTDVYSLGAVLYEILTLERPFPGDSREQVLAAIMTKEPRGPRRLNPRVPVDLETICLKALEKDPDRRYGTAHDMAEDLRAFMQRGLIAARRAGRMRRAAKWSRRHPVAVTAATLSLAAILAGTGLTIAFRSWNAGERAQRAVAEARVLLGQGEYRKGLARVDEALRILPGLMDARRARAEALLRAGHFVEAAGEAEGVLGRLPDDWTAHAVLAAAARSGFIADVDVGGHARAVERLAPASADAFYLRALLTEDSKERLRLLDRALDLDPSHLPAIAARADSLLALKDFAGAVAAGERMLAARPRSARGRRALGFIRWSEGDTTRALEEIDRAIALDPDDPISYVVKGRIEREIGRPEEAIADFTHAIEIDPHYVDSFCNRSWILYGLGRRDEAITDARRALDLNPDLLCAHQRLLSALARDEATAKEFDQEVARFEAIAERYRLPEHRQQAYTFMAILHSNRGEHEEALAAAERAIQARPGSIYGYSTRAQLLRRRDGAAAARDDCDRMEGLPLNTPADLNERAGTLRFQCDRPERALTDYGRAIDMAPAWAGAYQDRGGLLASEGRAAAALEDLTRAVDLSPWSAPALLARGDVLVALDREADALKDFEKAHALGMDTTALRASWANALVDLGRGDEALHLLDGAIERSTNPDLEWLRKAQTLLALGRTEEAVAAADKAIAIRPDLPWPHYYRGLDSIFLAGQCPGVADRFRKALGLMPTNMELNREIAYSSAAYLARACPDQYDAGWAARLAERGTQNSPRDPIAHSALAFVEYRRGDLARARREIEEAIRLTKTPGAEDPRDHFLLAMIGARTGDRIRARAEFDRAALRMQRWPKDPSLIPLRDEAASALGIAIR